MAKNAQLRNDGLINVRHPTHVKRNKRENIILDAWNILTMLKPGQMHEIAEQILNTQGQIVALQEILWKEYGHIRKEKYSLFCGYNPTRTGKFSTDFIAKTSYKECIRFECVSSDEKENFIIYPKLVYMLPQKTKVVNFKTNYMEIHKKYMTKYPKMILLYCWNYECQNWTGRYLSSSIRYKLIA
jgi:hypothetical protein